MKIDNKMNFAKDNARSWLASLLLVALLLPGCGYGKVSSRTYEISKALYSICNQKKPEKLDQVTKLIATSLEEKKVSQREANWLNEIVELATKENWDEATQKSRQIMEDQIRQ